MQALRHFYASVLINAGESVKAVAEYLGHADPGFALRVYAHLFSSSEERARQAVGQALRPRRSLEIIAFAVYDGASTPATSARFQHRTITGRHAERQRSE